MLLPVLRFLSIYDVQGARGGRLGPPTSCDLESLWPDQLGNGYLSCSGDRTPIDSGADDGASRLGIIRPPWACRAANICSIRGSWQSQACLAQLAAASRTAWTVGAPWTRGRIRLLSRRRQAQLSLSPFCGPGRATACFGKETGREVMGKSHLPSTRRPGAWSPISAPRP